MQKLKNALAISGVYIGVIIGAGFASGREITSFFLVHGRLWLAGMGLTGILFMLLGYIILTAIYENKITTYRQFTNLTMGEKLGSLMELISGLFLCVLFFAMAAASGAAAKEAFHAPYFAGVGILLAICFIIFLFDVKGVVVINAILSPMMIIGGIFIGVYTLATQASTAFLLTGNTFFDMGWAKSAFLYVSYNIITAISVLISVRERVRGKRIAMIASVVSGLSMGLLGVCIGGTIYFNIDKTVGLEIPMLAIVQDYSGFIKGLYLAILLSAILTTAVGNGFGAVTWLAEELRISSLAAKIFIIMLGFAASFVGFSGFVGRFYTIFGYLGLGEIIILLYWFIFKRQKKREKQ